MASGFPLACGLLLLLGTSPLLAQGPKPVPGVAEDFFEKEIRPLLAEKCAGCHGDAKAKGGLKLTSRAALLKGGDNGPAAVPEKPGESLLVKAVRYHDEPRMPPQGKLTDRQIAALERWVENGAVWPGATGGPAKTEGGFPITEKQRRFWSFQPVKAVAPPAVRDAKWPRFDLDHFILSKLEANGLAPAAPADKQTLLRRATFDLIGLPPCSIFAGTVRIARNATICVRWGQYGRRVLRSNCTGCGETGPGGYRSRMSRSHWHLGSE
jgi:hypothetical protein